MRLSDVAVATITRARDAAESVLMQEALTALSRLGAPVVFADGGSTPEFVAGIERLPGFMRATPAAPGLVPQVQAAVADALRAGRPFVLYAEPDKREFFEERAAAFVAGAPADAHTGVALAARSPASFATYPALQRYVEGAVNQLCETFIGERADYCYGPFLMHRRVAEAVARLPVDLGWGWRPCVFGLAARMGLAVHPVQGEHPCPIEQRTEDDEERLHRLRQLAQNAQGLALSQTLPWR